VGCSRNLARRTNTKQLTNLGSPMLLRDISPSTAIRAFAMFMSSRDEDDVGEARRDVTVLAGRRTRGVVLQCKTIAEMDKDAELHLRFALDARRLGEAVDRFDRLDVDRSNFGEAATGSAYGLAASSSPWEVMMTKRKLARCSRRTTGLPKRETSFRPAVPRSRSIARSTGNRRRLRGMRSIKDSDGLWKRYVDGDEIGERMLDELSVARAEEWLDRVLQRRVSYAQKHARNGEPYRVAASRMRSMQSTSR
jgi:hypothetical protein